jgi:hypothetical protein
MKSEFKYNVLNYIYHKIYLKKYFEVEGLIDFINSNGYFLDDKLCEIYKEYERYCMFQISRKLKINISKSDIVKYQEISRL